MAFLTMPTQMRSAPEQCVPQSDCCYVFLPGGYVAVIDLQDLALVESSVWRPHFAKGLVYARRSGPKPWYMHQLVCGVRTGFEVDHIDGNGLNNRRENLRHLTHAQNQQNIHGPVASSTTGSSNVCVAHIRNRRGEKAWTYYRVKAKSLGRSVSKYFPFTPDGLLEAQSFARKARSELMPYSEQEIKTDD